jgi:hypothetical protein
MIVIFAALSLFCHLSGVYWLALHHISDEMQLERGKSRGYIASLVQEVAQESSTGEESCCLGRGGVEWYRCIAVS